MQLPMVSTVVDLLSGTLGEKVDVKAVKAVAGNKPMTDDVTATFVDADGELVGACLLNLALAACLGAALVRIPAPAALEAAATKKLSGMLGDALYEVLNIAAQLFRATDVRHRIVLGEVYVPGQPVPDSVAAQLKKPAATLKVELKIPHYTSGMLTFVTLGG
jgi:anti-sigma factor RsiW